MATLIDEALALARAGWAVLPCHPESKAPLTKHGHLEATRGEAIIREWWEFWPNALIGAKVPDTLLVIDIDPRNGGSQQALEHLIGEPLPLTLTVTSGRGDGGRHHYFKRPQTIERFTSSRLPEGIDLKVNGYCIVPPSPHPATGAPYVWDRHEPVRLPVSLLALLIPPPRPLREPGAELRDPTALAYTVRNAPAGTRNSILHWAACRALEQGASETVLEALVDAAVASGLDEKEARRTIDSAARTVGA